MGGIAAAMRSCHNRGVVGRALGEPHSSPSHISKIVPPTIHLGPPTHTVDTTIFEMWLGNLSTHQGLSIPVVWTRRDTGTLMRRDRVVGRHGW